MSGPRVPQAFNEAMQLSGGKFHVAAADLARRIEEDADLRAEAATLLLALLLQPGFGEHDRIFKLDTGQTIESFVTRHCPAIR